MTRQQFIELIERDGKAVYSFCCMLAGCREDGEELYQETMLSAVEHCRNIDSSLNPKSYLMGTALKLYQGKRRKNLRRQSIAPMGELTQELEIMLGDDSPGPEERAIKQEQCMAVRQEVQKLPEKLRVVVYLYYTAQLSLEEIAFNLHIPEGTVKSRLHKARALLRKRLEVYGYEE